MNFLLKIVRGPNAGAEAALPDGVAVTLGKDDACDIVLADATLPDEAATLTAAGDGVTLDGERLAPFHVVVRGATAFAIGPSDAAWADLVWPAPPEPSKDASAPEASANVLDTPAAPDAPAARSTRGRGCMGCGILLVVVALALGGLGWFFRDAAKPYAERAVAEWQRLVRTFGGTVAASVEGDGSDAASPSVGDAAGETLSALAAQHGLAFTTNDARTVLGGNFATRVERLAVTAAAYAAQPGVDLDFSDDESLRTAATDTLALLAENGLRVAAATNRALALMGTTADLRRVLEALNADLPKLRTVDCAGVTIVPTDETVPDAVPPPAVAGKTGGTRRTVVSRAAASGNPSLPVCGILTTPYPCLVLRNGTRVMVGASLGDRVVARIDADAVTLTNATGSIVWKP